jgi:hypothetical protein
VDCHRSEFEEHLTGGHSQVTEIMKERHLAVAFFAALVFALAPCASAQVQPTLVGILEDNPGHYAGNPHYRDVRVVFRRKVQDGSRSQATVPTKVA